MIKNNILIQQMEDEFIKNNVMTIQEKFDMMDSIYLLAHSSGNLILDDTTGNLEALIKTLKIFRDASKAST
ncbi:MAG: hypothetical protein M3R36_06575 [Bacteroidota bacterium]|nr:hypothetical protein [Bacteroidota bacterium]